MSSRGPPEKGVEPRRLSGSSPSQLPPTDRESERDKENFRVFFFSSGVNLALLTRWVGIQISNPLYSPARGRSGARFTVGPSRRDADCGPRRILYRSRTVWACAVQAGALCCRYRPVGGGHCTGDRGVALGLRILIRTRLPFKVQTRGRGADRSHPVDGAQIFLFLSIIFWNTSFYS